MHNSYVRTMKYQREITWRDINFVVKDDFFWYTRICFLVFKDFDKILRMEVNGN